MSIFFEGRGGKIYELWWGKANFVGDMAVDLQHIPNIVAFIRGAWPVEEASLTLIASRLVARTFPRRCKLVSEGRCDGMVWFMENGMTRSYWLVDGEEITTSFSIAGCVVFSMDEVYYSLPSKEFVESIEPVEAYGIAVEELMELVSTDIGLCNWWRVIHQNEYRRIHRSHKERLTLDASARYRAFSEQFPEVCRRARLTDIASYVGVDPSTLSRIRGRLSRS